MPLFFPSLGALNPNSRQMEFISYSIKVLDDLLFILLGMSDDTHETNVYRCIHLPSLVTSTQLPGGSLSLTENAFAVLQPKCNMESRAMGAGISSASEICSISTCPPTRPRYCFIITRIPRPSPGEAWEVYEVEIDLSIPGPIKVFSKVFQQYIVQLPTSPVHDSDGDLLLYVPRYLPPGLRDPLRTSLGIRFLRVGKMGYRRLARFEGVVNLHVYGLHVDRDAGYVIIRGTDHSPQATHSGPFICWLHEGKPGNMVHSRTRGSISSWGRGLLRRFL